ncbi:MAG: ribosome small subunit-dependent GTPase A [Hyphomicrobiales bacterium]
MEGIVIKSTGSWYHVETTEGKVIECKLRGQFRIKGIKATNPIAVGDRVSFKMMSEKEIGFIHQIHARDNYIIRKATKLSKRSHILASNIDQAMLVVTLALPRTSTGFIDRFIVTAEAYHIPVCLIFNKIDLYNSDMKEDLKEIRRVYNELGYKTIEASATEEINLDEVKDSFKDKRTLISGHSGVGKSALINAIAPGMNLKVGEISDYHEKGKHTTTFAQMFSLPFGGHIIDTPGIKEFGLLDFDKAEVAGRFREFRALMHECKYSNCKHMQEPECAIKDAVAADIIAEWRYINYLNIMDDENMNETYTGSK